MYCVPRMLLILKHYIKDLLRACNHYHSSNCISTVNVNVITCLPASYKLTCIDNVQQACMASSVTHALHYPEALSHCGHGHDLTSVAQLSVINIADIRSAFDITLASECCRRNAADGAL